MTCTCNKIHDIHTDENGINYCENCKMETEIFVKKSRKVLITGLIAGAGTAGINSLMIQSLKEKHGENIIIYTPEEADKEGLKLSDFENIPSFPITAPPQMFERIQVYEPIPFFENGRTGKGGRARNRSKWGKR